MLQGPLQWFCHTSWGEWSKWHCAIVTALEGTVKGLGTCREEATISNRVNGRFPDVLSSFYLVCFGLVWGSDSQWGAIWVPQGTVGKVWRHFWLSWLGERSALCLVGGAQASCQAADGVFSPTTKNDPDQQVTSAAVQKPCFTGDTWKHQLMTQNLFFAHLGNKKN